MQGSNYILTRGLVAAFEIGKRSRFGQATVRSFSSSAAAPPLNAGTFLH